jgi:hypothetical protein
MKNIIERVHEEEEEDFEEAKQAGTSSGTQNDLI